MEGKRQIDPRTVRAAMDVLGERRRQTEEKGYTAERDAAYTKGELARAAAAYAMASAGYVRLGAETLWPWSASTWKPGEKRRALVKAGALVLAEIERLDRLTPPDAR